MINGYSMPSPSFTAASAMQPVGRSEMPSLRSVVKKVLVIAGLGFGCLPLLIALGPDFKPARKEARIGQAYLEVRYRKSHASESAAYPLPPADPWGQPYRLIKVKGKVVRVESSGPNMSSPDTGYDNDDIYTDMPESPLAPFRVERNRQLLIALGITAGTWIILTVVYLRLSHCSKR